MSNQENQSIKEKSERLAEIVKGIEKYGYELSDYDMGYVAGILGRTEKAESTKKQQEGG